MEETTKAEAEAMGALAFFDDKYGERVRVVRAGPHSIELCGGTHVGALGMIGPITVTSESSIGSNVRRLFAVTGASALERVVAREGLLAEAASLLRTEPEHVPEAIDRLLERQQVAERSLEQARSRELRAEAASLGAEAVDGVVVARRDGLDPDALRDLAQAAADLGRSPGRGPRGQPGRQSRRRWPCRPTRRGPTRSTPVNWSDRSPPSWAAAAADLRRWPWPAAAIPVGSTGPSTRPDTSSVVAEPS